MLSNEFGYSKTPVKFDNVGRMLFSCRPGNYFRSYLIYAVAFLMAFVGMVFMLDMGEEFFFVVGGIFAILLVLLVPTTNSILIFVATFAAGDIAGEGVFAILIPLFALVGFIAFMVYVTNNVFTRISIYERAVRINNFFNDELVHFKNIRYVGSAGVDGKGTWTNYCLYIDSRIIWGSKRKVLQIESLLVEALAKEELERIRNENLTDYKRRWRW